MTLKTTPWDSADYLKTEADRTAYLEACLEEAPDDPGLHRPSTGRGCPLAQHESTRARHRPDP